MASLAMAVRRGGPLTLPRHLHPRLSVQRTWGSRALTSRTYSRYILHTRISSCLVEPLSPAAPRNSYEIALRPPSDCSDHAAVETVQAAHWVGLRALEYPPWPRELGGEYCVCPCTGEPCGALIEACELLRCWCCDPYTHEMEEVPCELGYLDPGAVRPGRGGGSPGPGYPTMLPKAGRFEAIIQRVAQHCSDTLLPQKGG